MIPATDPSLSSPLIFVLPDDQAGISGGNLYNRHVLEALAHKALDVHVLSSAAAQIYLRQGNPGFYLVDSLLLAEIPSLTARNNLCQHVFLLTHYLPSFEPNRASPEIEAREQEVLKGLAGFVVTSSFMKSELILRRSERRPIIVVPPALVMRPSEEELACRRPDTGRFHGLMVANLSPVKRVLEFLRSLSSMLSDGDTFTIDIAGRLDVDRDYANACQTLVAENTVLTKCVRFRDVLPPGALLDLYLRSTVFISASEMESFGMALHEARTFGLPILAVDAGNVRAHVPSGKQGVLYRSIPDLAQDCIALARDPERLSRLGQSALDHRLIDSYSWSDAADILIAQFGSWSDQLR